MTRRKGLQLKRKTNVRPYRSVYWISTEGETERDYFSMRVFKGLNVAISFPPNTNRANRTPTAVLKRIKSSLRSNDFRAGDQAWAVVDVDNWDDSALKALADWADSNKGYHLAVSNPKFELYLLMHFEKASGCTTPQAVDARLRRHMPNYRKRISPSQFDKNEVQTAVENARTKRSSCHDVLPDRGMTDVYKLVESLLDHPSNQ